MPSQTIASAPGLRGTLVPEGYVELHRGYVEQAECQAARAQKAEAESDRLRGEIDRLAAHANLRRLTIKALARERDEREVEIEILRAHLKLVCEDAVRVAPFQSVERALALLAVERPCAPCAAGVPGSCNDLFEGAA